MHGTIFPSVKPPPRARWRQHQDARISHLRLPGEQLQPLRPNVGTTYLNRREGHGLRSPLIRGRGCSVRPIRHAFAWCHNCRRRRRGDPVGYIAFVRTSGQKLFQIDPAARGARRRPMARPRRRMQPAESSFVRRSMRTRHPGLGVELGLPSSAFARRHGFAGRRPSTSCQIVDVLFAFGDENGLACITRCDQIGQPIRHEKQKNNEPL